MGTFKFLGVKDCGLTSCPHSDYSKCINIIESDNVSIVNECGIKLFQKY